jgi:hypothetical protein
MAVAGFKPLPLPDNVPLGRYNIYRRINFRFQP